MKIHWSKRAKNDLNRILQYIITHFSFELSLYIRASIDERVLILANYPELGRKINKQFHKRYLVIDGNVIVYEIVLNKNPMVIIRSIRPRKATAV